MIDNIWDMYEQTHLQSIPHGYYLSEILTQLGAVSEDESVEIIPPHHRLISTSSFPNLKFSESSTEYIIDDRVNLQRVSFPKKLTEQEISDIPQPDMTTLLTGLQDLANMQSSQSQKQHSELMTMVTNIQKQIECQALEAERCERQAEIRARAIIWNMERQRYFYEQEQEQRLEQSLWIRRISVSKYLSYLIPSSTSRSRYYDPTEGDEIPKAFQDLFHDIYGTRC
ncbi:hypothetical protein HanRHA438_Chr14g0636901 [Helianthus annuus]|nr:hypothetical protein HanHA300_Chr14g0512161 [Helianthus annuus]KAJ0467029.1 hypothetical protein HanIR_Chr14g0678701 [Helianthus annuus]KAJ0484538.1 hypothetical protein HanHA89_Chr14g0545231 [Helianthus annuus]KAJ0655093.1 hypothetical protein HanLR1_Chr14g0514521 [Helianthus annuus]KAJ0658802.1 hypothetical protein HanOQP8_Chr14g0512311 [Helianthus annuus]